MTPILTQFPLTRWPLLIAGVSLALLLGAWGFQYIGHYDPCALCFDQRYIHMAVIGLGLASGGLLIVRPGLARLAPFMVLIMAAVLIYSAGFAFWHAGIEYKWWDGPETCTTSGGGSFSVADVLATLDGNRPVVMCDEASWTLLGISMAGYNALISAGMALVSIYVGLRGLRQ
ncbi:disulfide bond formation protein B [Maricaulis sp.]|uniref:disulfide bond formation protein B n=1 Tax=Maricaulis sp. TaxID=1486257 RepID=UPI0026095537|nr:disulfide bond formation protein B [Maricaulis sp.]